MAFFSFIKGLLLDGKNGLFYLRTGLQDLPDHVGKKLDGKMAVLNVKRIIPFSALIFLIEIANQLTILLSKAYPAYRLLYLTAGALMMLVTGGTIFLAYRTLTAPEVSFRRCRKLYRWFWALFTLGMLVFVYLELATRGLTNNFFYLLILTAAFPLLPLREALCLFSMDTAVMLLLAVPFGFTPQQLLQLPLVAIFALALSRILYNSHRTNDITLEKLEISNRKLASLAQTDPLTGLLNRRGVLQLLEETLSQTQKSTSVSFLMIDIDLFKSYNDRFGHEQGDQCLQKIASAIRRCTGGSDLAARFGGEEFLVALIGREEAAAVQFSRQLRREIENLSLPAATAQVNPYVTVSVGIAAAQTPFDFTGLYEQADYALYQAKNAGRNCVAAGKRIYRD